MTLFLFYFIGGTNVKLVELCVGQIDMVFICFQSCQVNRNGPFHDDQIDLAFKNLYYDKNTCLDKIVASDYSFSFLKFTTFLSIPLRILIASITIPAIIHIQTRIIHLQINLILLKNIINPYSLTPNSILNPFLCIFLLKTLELMFNGNMIIFVC